MTLMAFLLLIILFLAFFIYFSGLNPHEVAIVFFPDHQLTASVPLVVVGCILLGLVIGYLAHLYGAASYFFKDWRRSRIVKRDQEVAALHLEGKGYLAAGDYKKARRVLQKALSIEGSRITVLLTLAKLSLAEGDVKGAISLLQRSRKLAPENIAVLIGLAEAHLAASQQEEAMAVFSQILEIENDSPRALSALRDIYLEQNRWRDALELQKRLVKKNISGSLAAEKAMLNGLRFESACRAREDGQQDQALAELQSLMKDAPDFLPARVILGDILEETGRQEQAAKTWQEGYDRSGRSVFLSRLEDLAMAEEDPSGLLNFYRKKVQERPDDLTLHLFYGKFCLRLEMIEEALEQFSEVEKTGADFPLLHLLLAETHVRRQRLSDAVQEYRQALGGSDRFRWEYVCQQCGEPSKDWQGRCERCGVWGSQQLTGHHLIKGAPASELREIHHGERTE